MKTPQEQRMDAITALNHAERAINAVFKYFNHQCEAAAWVVIDKHTDKVLACRRTQEEALRYAKDATYKGDTPCFVGKVMLTDVVSTEPVVQPMNDSQ